MWPKNWKRENPKGTTAEFQAYYNSVPESLKEVRAMIYFSRLII